MITKPSASAPAGVRLFPILLLLCSISFHLEAASTESNLKKSFAVKPGGSLVMDVDSGSIEISTGERNDVAIEVKRKITHADSAKAQEIFAAHEVAFDQDGPRVEVHARFKKGSSEKLLRGRVNFEVQYLISLPRQFNLDLHTGSGAISSADIEGTVKVRTGGGDLKFASIKGTLDGGTSSGRIALANASGPVLARTSGGDIHLGQLEADTSADTASGAIAVKSEPPRPSVVVSPPAVWPWNPATITM